MTAIEMVCRALYAVVFGTAVAGKLRSAQAYTDYRDSVYALTKPVRLPAGLVAVLAVAVVAGEAATTVLVLVPGSTAIGFLLGAVLLTGFAVGIAGVLRQGRSVRCRCFGTGGSALGRFHLLRNVGLAGVGVLAAAVALWAGGAVPAPAALVLLTGGALCGLVVTRWDDLAFLLTGAPETTGGSR